MPVAYGFAGIADSRFTAELASIIGIPCELDMQCACTHRFGLRTVGTGVVAPVPPVDPPGIFGVPAEYPGREQHAQGRNPGRDPVAYVIGFGGGRSEIAVGIVAVTDHGIHSVYGFIQKSQRCAPQCQEKQGGDYAVCGIFRHGFHGGLRHLLCIQGIGIASHNPGDGLPCARQIPSLQCFRYFHALGFQGFDCQDLVTEKGLYRREGNGM